MISSSKREFIDFMIRSEVLSFGEYKLKSGRVSPYFINTGHYKTGGEIARLGQFYARLVEETLGGNFDALFGPAYKGIPLVTAAASALSTEYGIDKPFFFNRKEAKDHGEGGLIVGYQPSDGDTIIVIEDVITAGTAVREAMPLLKSFGAVTVQDMFITFDRCEIPGTPEQMADPAYRSSARSAVQTVLDEFGLNVHPIVTFYDLLEYLKTHRDFFDNVPAMEQYQQRYVVEKERYLQEREA